LHCFQALLLPASVRLCRGCFLNAADELEEFKLTTFLANFRP